MPLFTKADLFGVTVEKKYYETAEDVLKKVASEFSSYKTYDIFISHSYLDAEIVLKVKIIIEKYGFITYVDWIEDKQVLFII